METDNKTISEFLETEYKDYSFYVLESRALASLVDGFKPTQRKIIYVADKHLKKTFNKVATLAGKVISDASYHHGNVSCEGGIVNMAQNFKNNLCLFERDGQFGKLLAPDASASRYISVRLSENFNMVYKDTELLQYKEEEGKIIEPKYYLPIIPVVIVNGAFGIAVGFASNIMKRELKDVIKKCINHLEGKKVSKMKLHINEFVGDFVEDKEKKNKWHIKGRFERQNTSTIRITELPPSMTLEKFEILLDKIQDKRFITGWENVGKETVDYIVKFTREDLNNHNTDEKIYKLFNLVDQVTENFTVLDEFDKMKLFTNAEDILKHFVDFRLTYYTKRKQFQLEKVKKDINRLSNRAKFIKAILDGKIVINKKTKDQIIKQIKKEKIDMIEGSYDYLLSMAIYSLSKDKYDELLKSIKDHKEREKEIKKSIPKDIYLNELKELLKTV